VNIKSKGKVNAVLLSGVAMFRRITKFIFISLAIIVGVLAVLINALLVYSNVRGSQFVNEQLVFENRLAIPPLLEPHVMNNEKVFNLALQEGKTEFFKGVQTKTLGFNGSYLGPTIRVNTGDKVRIQVANDMDETSTVHWHGMHLPAAMDGGPHQIIRAGKTWEPRWTITNEAATLWYHPHLLGKTGEQVYRGLAGLFIIEDGNIDELGVPKEYGVDDIPLIVQDRLFDQTGQLVYRSENEAITVDGGMLGNTILVNGTYAPYLPVPAKLIRLRILNASNARRFNYGFSEDQVFFQIASDGGFLESPVELQRLILAPGERAEIVLDMTGKTEPVTLMSYEINEAEFTLLNAFENVMGESKDENQIFKIVELRPQGSSGGVEATTVSLPEKLNTILQWNEADAAKTRTFMLGNNTINGKWMDHGRIDEIIGKGNLEIWEITNPSISYHPFHIHGTQFQILDRNGQQPPANERGWKDTVTVNQDETVRVLVRFNDYSDPHFPYMFHCHILEHEDMGMMGQFVVVDDPSQEVKIHSLLLEMPETHTE
jgi:bilirubin oxidase